jgi:division protein CdvB (Snf7/Vps24/ESCRT-III family)
MTDAETNKIIAVAAETTYREMKEELKNQTPQRQLDLAIHRLHRYFTNIKVMNVSLQNFLDNMGTTLSENEEQELWAIESLLEQQLDRLEGFIDGASKYWDEIRKVNTST